MEVKNKKVLVFGSGISGVGAVHLLELQGAEVILYDGNDKLKEEDVRAKLDKDSKTEIILGEFPEELLKDLQLVILSPGVPTDLPIVEKMREEHIVIVGEIELAYAFGKGDVLAITGTNGKTTTTTLLGEIMKNYKEKVFVVGNIGNPYTVIADQTDEDTVIVAEMSSFQLESIDTFRPKVSAILNFTPDHLNRHHTMEAYVAKVFYFSSKRTLEEGIYLKDNKIIYHEINKQPLELCDVNELQILGTHNYENVMAASAMALLYGVPVEMVRDTIKAFKGVEHRIEYVAEKQGVVYYNDSKGTNPDAAIRGIQAMNRPTVLIGGGYDKNSEYTEWIQSFDGKVKKLILIGATREKIAADAEKCGFTDYVFAETFEEAVEKAVEFAKEGDAVLLSPACASWGMFPNYEVRGDRFKELVHAL